MRMSILGAPVEQACAVGWRSLEGLVAERGASVFRDHFGDDSHHPARPFRAEDVCLVAHSRHLTLITCTHVHTCHAHMSHVRIRQERVPFLLLVAVILLGKFILARSSKDGSLKNRKEFPLPNSFCKCDVHLL